MNRSDFRFLEPLRVRWAEVDMQQIVFNGHYLMYFDTAVAGYWRALAIPYHETMHALQGDLYVRKATLEYLASARYDDRLQVGIRCTRVGNSSALFAAAAFRGEQCLVHGELVYVFADPATQTSKPVPAPLRELFDRFESGQPVLDVRSGGWPELGAAAQALRRAVFVDELKIGKPDLVGDAADAGALHVVVRNHFGQPVAGGRLLQAEAGVGRIGRLATLAALRGAGLGRTVLDALAQAARERGDRELVLDAQAGAVAFYLNSGFQPDGGSFIEAGVPHVRMRRGLL